MKKNLPYHKNFLFFIKFKRINTTKQNPCFCDIFAKSKFVNRILKNIYSIGELIKTGTCSILEHMGNDGKQTYQTKYYNLDAILSVGYRVNSKNAIK